MRDLRQLQRRVNNAERYARSLPPGDDRRDAVAAYNKLNAELEREMMRASQGGYVEIANGIYVRGSR